MRLRLLAATLCWSFATYADCPSAELIVGSTHVRHSSSAIVFEAGLAIDADGAPDAYGPDGLGLDHLANAGKPGNWWAIVTEDGTASGRPVVQGPSDPAPGHYVSTTALEDRFRPRTSPARYVDSAKMPYVVLSPSLLQPKGPARLGDFAVVRRDGRTVFAIVADIGPKNQLGEGSIALARALGVSSDPKRGGVKSGVTFVVLPGSGNGKPVTIDELERQGRRAWENAGGELLFECR